MDVRLAHVECSACTGGARLNQACIIFGLILPILSALFTMAINKTGKMAKNKIQFLIKSPQETVGEIPLMRQKHTDHTETSS